MTAPDFQDKAEQLFMADHASVIEDALLSAYRKGQEDMRERAAEFISSRASKYDPQVRDYVRNLATEVEKL